MSEQQKEFPIGARVKTVQAYPGITHDGKTHGAFSAGVPVVVEGYNDDGSARFRINNATHIFDDPWRYLTVEKVVAKTEASEQWTDKQIDDSLEAISSHDGDIRYIAARGLMRRMRDEITASHVATIKSLLRAAETLQALEESGVDNWGGYSEAMELLQEWQANEHS